MISVSFDVPRLNRDLNQLAALLDLGNAEVVTRQAKLWLRDCIRATPPTGRGKAATSPTAQRELGERRISRDIGSWFPLVENLEAWRENTDLGKRLRELGKSGDFRQASKLLNDAGIPNAGTIRQPVRQLHLRARRLGGRSRRIAEDSRYFTFSRRGRQAYIAEVHKRLGQAKGGWGRAAGPLRVTLPGWAKRHAGKHPGHYRGISDKRNPSIEFGNGVPWLQSTAYESRIIKATARFRERQMKLELEKLWRFARNDNLAKIRARVKRAAFVAPEAA